MATLTIDELKEIAPQSMKIGDISDRCLQTHRGGGRSKFVEGETKTLTYCIVSNISGLCKNCWTIEMWAAQYEEIQLEQFYSFLQKALEHLQGLSTNERQKIWDEDCPPDVESDAFDEFLKNLLKEFK